MLITDGKKVVDVEIRTIPDGGCDITESLLINRFSTYDGARDMLVIDVNIKDYLRDVRDLVYNGLSYKAELTINY